MPYLATEDHHEIAKLVSKYLDDKVTAIVHLRMDKMEEKLAKLEAIDRITQDLKLLFK